MTRVAERSGLNGQEFLAWERAQPTRHEFFHGEVFAMAGGSPRHNALSVRTSAALLAAAGPKGCSVFSSDQRISIGFGERYVYPDVNVVCGEVLLEAGTRDVITNPAIVVEASPATRDR